MFKRGFDKLTRTKKRIVNNTGLILVTVQILPILNGYHGISLARIVVAVAPKK